MEKLITPTCEFGMPLPLMPQPEVPSRNHPENNLHHHFHPRRSPFLLHGRGMAIRNARGQLGPKLDHDLYHAYYDGPELPQTEHDRLRIVILAYAGYIPHEAIDLRQGSEPRVMHMSRQLRERVIKTGEIGPISEVSMRRFIYRSLVKQNLSHLEDDLVEEFIFSPNPDRRFSLGQIILADACELVTRPILHPYKTARKRHMLQLPVPGDPKDLVKKHLGKKQQVVKLHDRLAVKLTHDHLNYSS